MIGPWRDDEPVNELIRRVRTGLGISQYAAADRLREISGNCSIDREYVARWENGRRIPTPYWRDHLSVALDVPRGVLDRAAAVSAAMRAHERTERPTPELATALALQPAATSRTLEEVLELWDELMRRRAFLATTGATAASILTSSPSVPAAVADLDEAVRAHRVLTASYRRLDGVLGPATVFDQATEHQRTLTAWLRRTRNDTEWRQVADLAADANILLAWLHFDLDQYDQAALLYRQTVDIAGRMGDVNLEAFLIGRMSRTLSECGRDHDALTFAERAEHVAGTATDPAVRSWLAVTRAYVHACLGDDRASRAGLATAAGLLDRTGEPPPPYIAFYGRPYLEKWSGHALLRLAEHRAAVPSEGRSRIDQALSLWSGADVRESGEVLAASARAHLAERQVDHAADLTLRAHGIASGTGSPRVLRYVIGLLQAMHPYRNTYAVRRLDEQLLTGRSSG